MQGWFFLIFPIALGIYGFLLMLNLFGATDELADFYHHDRANWFPILDYWLRRILGSEDPAAFRQLSEAEVVKQSLERPVQVMEDLYGANWRDLASIVDEVRRGVAADEAWSEGAVVEAFNLVYKRVF